MNREEVYLPIVFVDLDGTITFGNINTGDMIGYCYSQNSFISFIKKILKFFGKKYNYKKCLSNDLDGGFLVNYGDFNFNVLKKIQYYKEQNYKIVLITGSHENIAKKVTEFFKFDDYICSSENTKMVGRNKLKFISEYIGKANYIYFGNALQDMIIFKHAIESYCVGPYWIQSLAKLLNKNMTIIQHQNRKDDGIIKIINFNKFLNILLLPIFFIFRILNIFYSIITNFLFFLPFWFLFFFWETITPKDILILSTSFFSISFLVIILFSLWPKNNYEYKTRNFFSNIYLSGKLGEIFPILCLIGLAMQMYFFNLKIIGINISFLVISFFFRPYFSIIHKFFLFFLPFLYTPSLFQRVFRCIF